MINGKSVSLCIVAYNSSELFTKCVESVKPIVDEIVVVDQSSDENHAEVLRKTADFYQRTTNKGNADPDRQYCYSLATKDLILALDTDEEFLPVDLIKLQDIKDDFDLMWFLFYNTLQYQDIKIDLKKMFGDDPHPRLWKPLVQNGRQQVPTTVWPHEAHQFPQINTDKQIFSNIFIQHNRSLETVLKSHVRRGKYIDPNGQELEKRFIRGILDEFGVEVKKQMQLKIQGLSDYLKG